MSIKEQEDIKEGSEQLGEKIVQAIKTVYDPEIPVDIYELGLIYDVKINDSHDILVIMTLTTPNCPAAEVLPQEVKDKVEKIEEVNEVSVEITFDPPWTKDMMSEEAQLELGLL